MSPLEWVAWFCVGLGGATGFGVLFSVLIDFWGKRKKKKPVNAIQDYADWKKQRRIEDRAKWDTAFYELGHGTPDGLIIYSLKIDPEKRPTRKPYGSEHLAMLVANHGTKGGVRMYKAGWDGRHLSTCPYECDCPQSERRWTPR